MKTNSLNQKLICIALLLFIFIVMNTGCENKQNDRDGNGALVGRAKLDSQLRAENSQMRTEVMFENCNETVVERKFLEYMDSYYPDYKIRGKIKIFEADKSDTPLSDILEPCAYNIRFGAVSPHTHDRDIIVVRFQYKSTNYEGFSVTTVRGILY